MKTRNILIVGVGGIGSWLAHQLFLYKNANQLDLVNITLVDDDEVDTKNLTYQNFSKGELFDKKSEVIGKRYGFTYDVKRIKSEEDLVGYDCIVCAVDNSEFRQMLFKFAEARPELYWIDLRSEGRTCAFYTKHKHNNYATLSQTLPVNSKKDGSCQLDWELKNGIVQGGNKIIASVGAQLILNWLRHEHNPPTFTYRF